MTVLYKPESGPTSEANIIYALNAKSQGSTTWLEKPGPSRFPDEYDSGAFRLWSKYLSNIITNNELVSNIDTDDTLLHLIVTSFNLFTFASPTRICFYLVTAGFPNYCLGYSAPRVFLDIYHLPSGDTAMKLGVTILGGIKSLGRWLTRLLKCE